MEEQLNQVVDAVLWQADIAALNEGKREGATSASVIRAAVTAALRGALHNRLITLTPEAEWPWAVERPPVG